ncbi:2-dehydropantoate 2-reductase N-terminal domain-containing protein [uncultured Shewanella sp.]|uniref:ketopantoate reductase family protein n=1 Tax=uncultured Shewanella sp. TaxID=173975 RepID=UPI00261D4A2E|nr:2-dehydropantoate 2-reductase N-terminal domain-containing protein [uncultured Shewanella sp.]
MKISIIGVGAIGGYIAANLLKCQQYKVQLLVKPSSALLTSTHLSVAGLTELTTPTDEIITDINQMNGDVIFITTKSTSNDTLFASLRHLKNKIFIILQNGIGVEDLLAQHVDDSNTIIGAISNIKLTKGEAIGQVILHSDFCNIVYATSHNPAPKNPSQQKRLLSLPALFHTTFRDVHCLKNIYQVRFPKLMINIACNAASIIDNQTLYGLSQSQTSRQMIHLLSEEVRQVSQYYNVEIKANMMTDIVNSFNATQYKNVYFSMKQDFDLGLPLEMKNVFYHFIELATQANIPTPTTNSALFKINTLLNHRENAKK